VRANRFKSLNINMLRGNTLSYLNTFCRSHRTAEQITRYLRRNGFPGLGIGLVRSWLQVLHHKNLVTSRRGAGFKITERGRDLAKAHGTRSNNQKKNTKTWNGGAYQLSLFRM
jgi:uncharacterized protein YjhX (UPF0386 family)